MANPLPCKICETEGIATPSDWLVTAQSEVMGFTPGNTFYVCMGCLAGLGFAWAQDQAAPPDEPGVLEQIEVDEGRQPVAARKGRARKSAPPEPEPVEVEVSEEASAADVHE